MKKIINRPADFVDETMEGIVAACGDHIRFLNGDRRVLISGYPVKKGKVGIVTAGGSGHLPLFLGYVGAGMADACAVGNVFASPAYTKMAAAIRAADSGAGVLCLYGNYGGDRMNFEQAIEDCAFDGIRCRSVRACDDAASAPKENAGKRRGVAGIFYAYKCAGAAADQMRDLDAVAAVAEKAAANTRTMGVALTPCIVPEAGRPTFAIAEDEMEVGMGIHGEKGITVEKLMTADRTAGLLMERLLDDMPLPDGSEVSVLVNGLGGTPAEELFIVYRRVARILEERGVKVFMPHVGEYATAMEMAGLSVTLFRLDDELKELLDAPCSTPALKIL